MTIKILLTFFAMLYLEFSFATSPIRIDLSELVKHSDHIIIGEVSKVDMIDDKNNHIVNPFARTGPEFNNEIRLHIKIKETITSSEANLKKTLIISFNKYRRLDLQGAQDIFSGRTEIFFLKGANFQPSISGYFIQPISKKIKIINILNNRIYAACKALGCLKPNTINITTKHPYPYLPSDFKCSSYRLKKSSKLCKFLKKYNDR